MPSIRMMSNCSMIFDLSPAGFILCYGQIWVCLAPSSQVFPPQAIFISYIPMLLINWTFLWINSLWIEKHQGQRKKEKERRKGFIIGVRLRPLRWKKRREWRNVVSNDDLSPEWSEWREQIIYEERVSSRREITSPEACRLHGRQKRYWKDI